MRGCKWLWMAAWGTKPRAGTSPDIIHHRLTSTNKTMSK